MKRLLWVNGRLPWLLVASVVYLTVSALIVDYVWRVLVIQFDTLLLSAVVIDAAVAIGIVVLYYNFWRQR